MRKAGIREARQNLTALIEHVRKGKDVLITDRGRPVARLVPPPSAPRRGMPDLARFRKRQPRLDPPLSTTIAEDREDRL